MGTNDIQILYTVNSIKINHHI